MFAAPVHTATLRGKPLRFFRSPVADPELPWHATEDLHRALDLPRELRRMYLRGLQGQFKDDVRVVDTEEGIATIAPHSMAQALVDAVIQTGRATGALEVEYCEAASSAMKALTAHLSEEEKIAWVMLAGRRHIRGDETDERGVKH